MLYPAELPVHLNYFSNISKNLFLSNDKCIKILHQIEIYLFNFYFEADLYVLEAKAPIPSKKPKSYKAPLLL